MLNRSTHFFLYITSILDMRTCNHTSGLTRIYMEWTKLLSILRATKRFDLLDVSELPCQVPEGAVLVHTKPLRVAGGLRTRSTVGCNPKSGKLQDVLKNYENPQRKEVLRIIKTKFMIQCLFLQNNLQKSIQLQYSKGSSNLNINMLIMAWPISA